MAHFQPGASDPYWYEWFVGLDKIIDLLLPGTNLESVTFQHANLKGIDDVVVRYKDETAPCCYQVKHTRADEPDSENITFGNLTKKNESGVSLIGSLASGWKEFREANGVAPEVILYSNRNAGPNASNTSFKGEKYKRKPLGEFFELIHDSFSSDDQNRLPAFSDHDDDIQFRQLVDAIGLEQPEDIVGFLKSLQFGLSKPSLSDAESNLTERLKNEVCGGHEDLSRMIFRMLCSELRNWTTSGEGNVVTKKEALRCLAQVNENRIRRPVVVSAPDPIFPSRMKLSDVIARRICESDKRIIFINGTAGAGKTRLVSCLNEALGLRAIRFYAFKPLDVDDFCYSPDRGIVDARSMWSTLVNQLRRQVLDPYGGISIPVINDLCTEDELRLETMRLATLLSEQCSTDTILIIDGIDHAARANDRLTFLSHLPSPDSIPTGVKLVLVGQPKNNYSSYPSWLQTQNPKIEEIDIPNLELQDVECLLYNKSKLHQEEIKTVASRIMALTLGNTLSVVYGVSSVAHCDDAKTAINILETSGLSSNIEEYYASIWDCANSAIQHKTECPVNLLSLLACTAHLFDGLIDQNAISDSFPEAFPQKYIVEESLLLLKPLFRRGVDGLYRPLHNDFRLFVSKLATSSTMKPCMKYVAERLAEYVLKSEESLVRSCFGIRVLSAADRSDDCIELFDTSFVIRAVSQGAPWDLMEEQAAMVYEMACNSRDLLNIQKIESAMATLSQIDEHIRYREENYPNARNGSLSAYDVIRVPLDSDHVCFYKSALERMIWLYMEDPGTDAAHEMFEAWLGTHTPSTFVSYLKEKDSNYCDIRNTVEDLMFLWGRFAALTNKKYDELNFNYKDHADLEDRFPSFRDGYVLEKLKYVKSRDEAKSIVAAHGLSFGAVETALKNYLCLTNRINSIGLSFISERLIAKNPKSDLTVRYAATALSDGAHVETNRHKDELLNRIDKFYFSSEKTFSLIAKSFLFGYSFEDQGFAKACSAAEIALSWLDSSDYDYMQFINRARAAVCLGYSAGHSLPIAKGTPEAQCIERYMANHGGRTFDFLEADCLLQYMINTGAATRLSRDVISDSALESFALSSSPPMAKLRLLDNLVCSDKKAILEKIVEKYYGKDGSVLLSDSESAQLHPLLRDVLIAVDPTLAARVDRAIPAMISSFTDHKDYSLIHLVKLFELGTDRGTSTMTAAKRLQNIDAAASRAGGNRMSEDVKEALLCWSLSRNLTELCALRDRDEELKYDYFLLWKQFRPLLSHARTTQEILACFAVVYGISSYYDANELFQIREAAVKSLDASIAFGCLDEVEPLIGRIAESLPDCKTSEPECQKDGFVNSYEREEAIKQEAVKSLEDKELLIVAYEESFDRGGWTRAHAACEEMVSRGAIETDVYEKLVDRRIAELSQGGWERTSAPYRAVIEKISKLTSDEAFFRLLKSRNSNLCQYGFGSASTDIAFAIRERIASHLEYDANDFFDIEYESKVRWSTANRSFELPELKESADPEPENNERAGCTDLVFLCTDILVDLLIENDPHRSEDAVRGIAWLGSVVPSACGRVFQRFGELTPRARVLVIKLADYWSRLDNDEADALLYSAMIETKSCSELMLLGVMLDAIPPRLNSVRAENKEYISRFNSNFIPSKIDNFLDTSEMLGVDCSDIRQEIKQSPDCDSGRTPADGYRRREDVVCPIEPIERAAETILYRAYSEGRWAKLPVPYIAARLIDPSDVWVMSSLPKFENPETSGVNSIIATLENDSQAQITEAASTLARINLDNNNELLGWKVYIPFAPSNQYELFETTRVELTKPSDHPPITDAALGCYGAMAWDLGWNQSSFDESSSSHPLCCIIGGCITMTWCDAQIIPADTLYHLGLVPKADDPLVWVDGHETPVIWFERTLFLVDHDYSHEAYYRQPQVWRWVYNKSAFSKILASHDCDLYRVKEEHKGDDPLHANYKKSVEKRLVSPFEILHIVPSEAS